MVQLPWWHWGVAGGWAAFRAGGGASGRGRRVRAQPKRGGGGRPRPRQVAGWTRRCRRASGSSGGSGDCSWGSLRIFLGQVQDGGAPCTGFPVTLAMGRTTKEGGEGCARSWRSPEESGQARPDKPRPFLGPPILTCRAATIARPLALTLEGAEKALLRKRSLLSSPRLENSKEMFKLEVSGKMQQIYESSIPTGDAQDHSRSQCRKSKGALDVKTLQEVAEPNKENSQYLPLC